MVKEDALPALITRDFFVLKEMPVFVDRIDVHITLVASVGMLIPADKEFF